MIILPLHVSVRESHIEGVFETMNKEEKQGMARRVTKLDYLQYMMEKFGSRHEFAPNDKKLLLNTTFIVTDTNVSNAKALQNKCENVINYILHQIRNVSKKDFSHCDWKCNSILLKPQETISFDNIAKIIINCNCYVKLDKLIIQIITLIPIQIARGSNNQFYLMHNGEDDQKVYNSCHNVFQLQREICFGAYDSIFSQWDGQIKIVSSMGKQKAGKSFMLNHLFGCKFDVAGGRCTDGACG